METRIFVNGRYRNINPADTVNTTKRMRSFAVYNNFRDCVFKSQGGWYKLGMDGTLLFVTAALYLISFNDLYEILKDS